MDTFFDFLPALLIFWVVMRALRGQKRRRTQPRVSGQATGSAVSSPRAPGLTGFEELVRRLEAAAAEAARQNGGVAPAPPALPPPAFENAFDEEAAFQAQDAYDPEGEFHFIGAPGEGRQETEFHETHTLERDPAPSTLMPSLAMPSLDMPSGHLHDPARPSVRAVHPLVTRLRTIASAREAVILKDVLGPPRSRRR